MEVRFYVCPMAYKDTEEEPLGYYPKLHDYACHIRWSAMIPNNPDGTPKYNRALVMVTAEDHSAYQADPQIIDILAPLNFEGNTKSEIIARLKAITVGDIPVQRRKAILDRLEAIGISKQQIRDRIYLTDSVAKVIRLLFEYFENDHDTKTADDEIEKGYLGE